MALQDPEVARQSVRSQVLSSLPTWWGELGHLAHEILPNPLEPSSLLPMAACEAAGGERGRALAMCAAWTLIGASVRILDDCADADNPSGLDRAIGAGRAMNIATALMTQATGQLLMLPVPPKRRDRILSLFVASSMRVWAGQDRDMRGGIENLSEYLTLVNDKTGVGFAAACGAGTLCATDREADIVASYRCGLQIGTLLQLLDDIEALWAPDGPSDWCIGKTTYPVLAAIERSPEAGREIRALLKRGDRAETEAQLLAVLDQLDMRRVTLAVALEHKRIAIRELEAVSEAEQCGLMRGILDWVTRDIQRWR